MADIMGRDIARFNSQLLIGPQIGGVGARRIALLEAIGESGSISAAAKAVGLSYKGAWDAVNAANNLADEPLVSRTTGGVGGGGTRLTDRGRRLVAAYRAAEQEQARFLAQLNRRMAHLSGDDLNLMERLAMQTSARNQLLGRVVTVTPGRVNVEVTMEMAGGDPLVATITRVSADNLGLEPGMSVTALVKASWVVLAAGDASSLALSARNRLVGTVETIVHGDTAGEITLRLPGGTALAAVVTRESVDELDLAEGDIATALFKASHVIIAQHT